MNARIFVGKELCQNSSWLHTSADFSTCIFTGSAYLKLCPSLLRPAVSLFIPQIAAIRRHRRNAHNILVPEIQRRRAQSQRTGKASKTNQQDMLQWLDEASTGNELRPERLADQQLALGFAATHGTTNLIMNTILDLAARWNDYAPELRAELDQVRAEYGDLTHAAISRLSKLDSFIKESQRVNPGGAREFFSPLPPVRK